MGMTRKWEWFSNENDSHLALITFGYKQFVITFGYKQFVITFGYIRSLITFGYKGSEIRSAPKCQCEVVMWCYTSANVKCKCEAYHSFGKLSREIFTLS